MLRVAVSGSFHRHMRPIYEAVGALRDAGVDVLSPSDPRVVDHVGDFLFVASDKLRSIKLVQDRHLQAIRASNFLWVVCPDGYTGPSVSMEIGAAYSLGVPVFSADIALDSTLGAYVRRVRSIRHAVQAVADSNVQVEDVPDVLLDPVGTIERSQLVLDGLKPYLIGRAGDGRAVAERKLDETRRWIRESFVGVGSRTLQRQ